MNVWLKRTIEKGFEFSLNLYCKSNNYIIDIKKIDNIIHLYLTKYDYELIKEWIDNYNLYDKVEYHFCNYADNFIYSGVDKCKADEKDESIVGGLIMPHDFPGLMNLTTKVLSHGISLSIPQFIHDVAKKENNKKKSVKDIIIQYVKNLFNKILKKSSNNT